MTTTPDPTPEQTDNRERPEDGEQDVLSDDAVTQLLADVDDDQAQA